MTRILDADFSIGSEMMSILEGGWRPSRGPSWRIAEYKPKGLWTISRPKRRCRVHMVSRALIAWRSTGEAQIGVLTRCGYTIFDAHTSAEDLTDDYCDQCLVADDERFAVYRFFDGDGNVLYIGYTANIVTRTDLHRSQSKWWPKVRDCSVEWFSDELAARRAETAAIAAERPPYNTRGIRAA